MDPMFQRRDGHHLRLCIFVIQHGFVGGRHTEPPERVSLPFQEHLEQ